MKIFKLKYSQKLPINLNEAWDFLSSPNNLELITPKSMDFNIIDWDKKKACVESGFQKQHPKDLASLTNTPNRSPYRLPADR